MRQGIKWISTTWFKLWTGLLALKIQLESKTRHSRQLCLLWKQKDNALLLQTWHGTPWWCEHWAWVMLCVRGYLGSKLWDSRLFVMPASSQPVPCPGPSHQHNYTCTLFYSSRSNILSPDCHQIGPRGWSVSSEAWWSGGNLNVMIIVPRTPNTAQMLHWRVCGENTVPLRDCVDMLKIYQQHRTATAKVLICWVWWRGGVINKLPAHL